MSDETSIDDLFGEDEQKVEKPKEERKPKPKKVEKPKVIIEDMSDEDLAALIANDPRKGLRAAAEAEVARRANPDAGDRPGDTEMIDNSVRIRRLDWECVCGNTNTLDLQLCGKCRAPRYSN